jgi:putative restriction endonuclease
MVGNSDQQKTVRRKKKGRNMPAINPGDLVDAVIDAIQQSGYTAILIGSIRRHPRRFAVSGRDDEDTSINIWVYAWTLTFGGRKNLPDEYRIQMTTVESPLDVNKSGPTLLMGYEPDLGMFAGFDLTRHRTFTSGSPSVQIDHSKVRDALQHGITFDLKDNGEIAVGLRPDQFINYTLNAEHLHSYGSQPETFRLLTRAAELQEITQAEIEALPENRRRIVQTVRKFSRKANFRQQVLNAYGHRCAVTRAQLRLVDAAHIVPVGAPESSDHITNGLALSPTYHRAYDNGLIYLDDDYVMKVNTAMIKELIGLKLHAGIDEFKRPLGRILLPQDPKQHPKVGFIKKANVFRRIPIT